MPKINSLEVVHQDTNKDSYQNLHDILKGLLTNQSAETIDGAARASIENLLEIYANDKEAFLRSLQTLTTQFKNSQAQFSEEILLKASELEALARRTSVLTAQTQNQYASVKEYAEAVASETARKVSTYRQPEPPTENLSYGDLWFDTDNNNKLYWWNGLVWSESSDTYNLNDFINTTYAADYAAIEAQVDSKAETWFQITDPSTAWTTQLIRDQHDKDLWYNSSTKLLKIYSASSNTWTTVQDQTAIDAAAAASTAQETADGKIVTFVQSSTPTAEGVGDLWLDSDDNRKMYRWNGTSWVAVDDSRIATTYARWGVQVDVNGRIAGIQLNSNNTGTSEFTVLADNFKVYKSGYTSNPLFSVGAVNGVNTVSINGNLVIDGSIKTIGIGSNAVSQIVSVNGVYSASVSFSIDNTYQVYIIGNWVQGTGRNGLPVYLRHDSTDIGGGAPIAGTMASLGRVATLTAGTHTASIVAPDTVGDMLCNVTAIVFKR